MLCSNCVLCCILLCVIVCELMCVDDDVVVLCLCWDCVCLVMCV